MKLKIYNIFKKNNQVNTGEPSKPNIRSQTRNLLNHKPGLNYKTQFSTNLNKE
jgi:hypothetical protein